MDTQLTRAARVQLTRSLRRRYQAASRRAKKQILSEFIAISDYHPKYAIHGSTCSMRRSRSPQRVAGACGRRCTTTLRNRR
jgi:hypothetical protein